MIFELMDGIWWDEMSEKKSTSITTNKSAIKSGSNKKTQVKPIKATFTPYAVYSEEEDEGTDVKEWTHNSRSYLKSCESNCDEDDCNCSGVVYNEETQDQIGTWNGKFLVATSFDDDDE